LDGRQDFAFKLVGLSGLAILVFGGFAVAAVHGVGSTFAGGAAVCRVDALLSEFGEGGGACCGEVGALLGPHVGQASVAVGPRRAGERGPTGTAAWRQLGT